MEVGGGLAGVWTMQNVDKQTDMTVNHMLEFIIDPDLFGGLKAFQEEVEGLIKAGVVHIVMNLRLVKFINSTALGGLIKASKILTANGGQLQISRPSRFCSGGRMAVVLRPVNQLTQQIAS